MKKLKFVKFANSLDKLPVKYFKAMTDEEFYLAMFYNIWPNITDEFVQRMESNENQN